MRVRPVTTGTLRREDLRCPLLRLWRCPGWALSPNPYGTDSEKRNGHSSDRREDTGPETGVVVLPVRNHGSTRMSCDRPLSQQFVRELLLLCIAEIRSIAEHVAISKCGSERDHTAHPVRRIRPQNRPRSHGLHEIVEIPVKRK